MGLYQVNFLIFSFRDSRQFVIERKVPIFTGGKHKKPIPEGIGSIFFGEKP
jgi:hypothetical protein